MTKTNYDNFFKYFRYRTEFVEKHCLDSIEGLILMCSYLDSLGGYRYPDLGNRQRFCKFVLEFSGVPKEWQRVSLWLLRDYWKKKDAQRAGYFEKVFRKMGVTDFDFYRQGHNPDVEISLIEETAAGLILTPFADYTNAQIRKFEYINILWKRHRNLSIHATTRHDKSAPNIAERNTEPYYIHITPYQQLESSQGGEIQGEVWFEIPGCYILNTLKKCLTNFENFAREIEFPIIAQNDQND